MPQVVPSDVITVVAGLMNDSSQSQYSNTVCLPYFNLALDILQETFELNGLSTTYETNDVLNVPAGTSQIGFSTTPALPSDLIEIQEIWESPQGLNQWTEVIKKDFLPHYLQDGTMISQFLIYTMQKNQMVQFIAANQPNDLRIDYVANMFNTPILIANVGVPLTPFVNLKTFLEFETAALCAMFIAENPTRAQSLSAQAGQALDRTTGIQTKGLQTIITRRRPFRYAYKGRGMAI